MMVMLSQRVFQDQNGGFNALWEAASTHSDTDANHNLNPNPEGDMDSHRCHIAGDAERAPRGLNYYGYGYGYGCGYGYGYGCGYD